MPSQARALAVLLCLAACRGADDHPAEVVGTWASRDRFGGRVVDTLQLAIDGTGWTSANLYRVELREVAGALPREDTVLSQTIPTSRLRWHVQRNDDGRHLCMVQGNPMLATDTTCAPLKVVPGTSITVGDVTYTRAK